MIYPSSAEKRIAADLMQQAVRGAVEDKKERAWVFARSPNALGLLCRDLPGYNPERMVRCLKAIIAYRRAGPSRWCSECDDEQLTNSCAALLYVRLLRAKERQFKKARRIA